MGRNWSPKYSVLCFECGWQSKRTQYTTHNDCPRCGLRRVGLHPVKEAKRILRLETFRRATAKRYRDL